MLCINGLFAQTPNAAQIKEYIAKNQSRFEQEIGVEKKTIEEKAKYMSNGLGMMARIVAAFNKKNASDQEATKLAQQALEKMQQIVASELWKTSTNQKSSRAEKLCAQSEIYDQIEKFRAEQTAKDSAKEIEYKAQKAIIQGFLNKIAESANV